MHIITGRAPPSNWHEFGVLWTRAGGFFYRFNSVSSFFLSVQFSVEFSISPPAALRQAFGRSLVVRLTQRLLGVALILSCSTSRVQGGGIGAAVPFTAERGGRQASYVRCKDAIARTKRVSWGGKRGGFSSSNLKDGTSSRTRSRMAMGHTRR